MKPVRRTQAISPFGIGAMVDFPGPTSLVHAGLDAWPIDPNKGEFREFKIDDEPRLARRLGVDFFALPPDYRRIERGTPLAGGNYDLKLPFLRFPLWHVCPYCGRMHKAQYHDRSAPTCKGPLNSGGERGKEHHERKTVQVRFVAACPHGHMQDFPWLEWLRLDDAAWSPEGPSRWLRLRATGSAGAEGIDISAEERRGSEIVTIKHRTLAGAIGGEPGEGDSPLAKIGIKCRGHNPALAKGEQDGDACGEHLFVLLRGASNLYFADVVSSIYVPDVEDATIPQEVLDILEDYSFRQQLLDTALETDDGFVSHRAVRNRLGRYYPQSKVDPSVVADAVNKHHLRSLLVDNGKIAATLIQMIKSSPDQVVSAEIVGKVLGIARPDWSIDPRNLVAQINEWYRRSSGEAAGDGAHTDNSQEAGYRAEEYRVFCRDAQEGTPKTNLLIRSHPIDDYGVLVRSAFDRISLLHKLRETRAFRGFSRIYSSGSLTEEERWRLIALERKNWLPAIIVRGEGIFLRFRKSALTNWERERSSLHRERLDPVNRNLAELRSRRRQVGYAVTPRFVLLHTFAHLLISQLVFDCGYGSASLRERIYCHEGENEMAGILIYTAAGDSEGTMGGLVRMGKPDLLDRTIARALEKARWCSTDPVCIESHGQGPDSCNLAACHSCALVPETSCEEQNRLLDRGVVVGTLEHPESGFFGLGSATS